MKHLKLISSILAAGAAGVAFAKLGNAEFLTTVSGDRVFAVTLFLGILAFAAYDLARCVEPLKLKTPLLRPALPRAGAPRATAYGVSRRSAIVERTAA
ncbi:MAG: hypothetical protein HYV95_00150 [Opitutae bacterium]|nr:hypothetical protein [Opitutae bacterium]